MVRGYTVRHKGYNHSLAMEQTMRVGQGTLCEGLVWWTAGRWVRLTGVLATQPGRIHSGKMNWRLSGRLFLFLVPDLSCSCPFGSHDFDGLPNLRHLYSDTLFDARPIQNVESRIAGGELNF